MSSESVSPVLNGVYTIVRGYAQSGPVSTPDLLSCIRQVYDVLADLSGRESSEIDAMAEEPEVSIGKHFITCLECGQKFKLLSNRHLALHKLTPRTYKKKYKMRLGQPLSSRELSRRRSKLAREREHGKWLSEWRQDRGYSP